MPESEAARFVVGDAAQPAFFRHIQWSAEPDAVRLETHGLPILALRHFRTRCSGAVEVIANVPREEDWDALFVNRSGTGNFSIDLCGTRREVPLHRDLCCFVPAGADNRLRFNHDSGAFGIYFQPGLIARLLESEGRSMGELAPVIGAHRPRVAHLMGLIEGELFRPSLGSRLMIDGLLRAIAGALASGEGEDAAAQAEKVYLSPSKLRRVIDFIEANLHESIGLDDLASAAGLSANHFLRVFKLATGETPYHFVRARRLERARVLLAEHSMPLAELALECGFANQAHFTAAFSRELGISPGRYRRAVRA